MTKFLHGSEVLEIDDGVRSIATVRTAVIGLAFASSFAAPAVGSSLSIGSVALNDAITLTSVDMGNQANAIGFSIAHPSEASAAITVTVADNIITVSLATNEQSVATSTATEIVQAITDSSEASALVVAKISGGTGSEVPEPLATRYFTGGKDEPFPVNQPVLITGSVKQAEGMGVKSSAYQTVSNIMKQTGALVVAVRATSSSEGDIIKAIGAFSDARSLVGYKPRILIAPEHSHIDGVGKELEVQAERLRGFAYLDCELTATYTDAMKRARMYGKRVEIQWPQLKVIDPDTSVENPRPTSEFSAGLRCRIDNEKGVHWSKSNQEIFGIKGTWQPVQWELSDPNTVANILNENRVSTVILDGGFRFWGNRSCAIDPKWSFECVRRTADMINDSIESAHLWAVDRPGTTQYMQDVIGGVQAYMKQLKFEGVIPGGDAWLDKDLNTPETMAQGIYYFDYDFGVYYPAEHLVFRSRLNNGYLEEVVANV